MKTAITATLLLLMILGTGCKRNKFKKDVSGINVDISINRLDRELHRIRKDSMEDNTKASIKDSTKDNMEDNTKASIKDSTKDSMEDNIKESIPDLQQTFGNFFALYNRNILKIGSSHEKQYPERLRSFLTDFTVEKAFGEVMEKYKNISDIEAQLQEAFRYYAFYFPEKSIPSVYTYVSGFNQSIVVADSILAIGLDKYLGRNAEVYTRLMVKNYLRKNMQREKIVPDCMKAWGLTEWVFNDSLNNVINNMVYRGKILYFQRCMLPEVPDSVIMGFTARELSWCRQNEEMMWEFLIKEDLLFNRDYMVINKLTNDAPYTGYFSNHSPGRAANWIGWQIVRAYMDNNRVSLIALMENNDYQQILKDARYKP